MLVPPHKCFDPSPFPMAVHLSVAYNDHAVPMSLRCHRLSSIIPTLVGSPRLVIACDLGMRMSFPFRSANHMLGIDVWIAQKERVLHHSDELIGWEINKFRVVDSGVVNLN